VELAKSVSVPPLPEAEVNALGFVTVLSKTLKDLMYGKNPPAENTQMNQGNDRYFIYPPENKLA
jgi:hypothetical protein|tara:strand:+ start:1462 stop:1653 length:192 start_codon:yes stop_codon:yes gene_type:complete